MPIPVWEDDFSGVANRFRTLREAGVTDLRAYLQQHPDELDRLVSEIRVLDVNSISLEFFDVRDKAELLGSVESELTEDSRAAFCDEMAALYAGKTRFSAEVPIYTRKGERRIVSFQLAVASGFEESLERVLITFIDITERKKGEERLRESEQRFRFMADGLPLIIWVHDAQGDLRFVNQTYRQFFGVTEAEVFDQGWRPLVHPEDKNKYVEKFEACVQDQKPFQAEARARRADGQWRWIESYAQPRFTPEGHFVGFVGTSPDITERKAAEAALRRSHDELEARVEQRTEELRQRVDQLARLSSELSLAEQRERQRLAGVLHDNLQQILTSILFRMEMVARRAGGETRSDIEDVNKLIKESIRISRSLTADLSPPILNEGGLIPGLEWLCRRMQEQYGLSVELTADTEDLGEPEDIRILLFQSVRELLINAAKHSGVSWAGVDLKRVDADRIAITVSDRGVGMDLQEVETESYRFSSGFGLFSIRERLDLLGGRMEIAWRAGRSAFCWPMIML